MSLPTGTVTFLFTDIEGSTRLWEEQPDAMRLALARHNALVAAAIGAASGHVFKTVGDAFCAAFARADEAVRAMLAAQRALQAEPWPDGAPIRVRMALHTGAADIDPDAGDYFGPTLNRVARLLAVGHGGQALLSDVTHDLARDSLPAGCSLTLLGVHRLKDLGRPETVYQLCHPGLPTDFPPLRSLDNPKLPNNLPQQVTSFIGREKELAEVKSLLEKTRLVTLTGAGGCGKTRLALQAAADLLDGTGDGVWLVELAPLADAALVPQAVASVLGVQEEPGKSPTQNLIEHLRSKRLLLLLDNCEHLLDACASLADAILRHAPNALILATSREGLGIAGELTYRVPSLSLPDPKRDTTPESLSHYEAVRLFIERAQLHQPQFTVTSQNAPALASVCHRLDGIPLAIELAAARVRSLSVEEVNSRLDQRFRLLTGGSRTALPRQQTLRSLIDWSYDLLNESEKTLLCRLSVFAGGWTLEAAEAVCSGEPVEDWEVLDLLTSLADKSLVVVEERDGRTRYGLLETVRQYARERLMETGRGESVRAGHRDYFLAQAEAIGAKLNGPEQAHWYSVLEEEHDNLRAALTFCLEEAELSAESEGAEKGMRLGRALEMFWRIRGHLREGRQQLDALLSLPGAQGRTKARGDALHAAGILADLQGDVASARALYEESVGIRRELGDQRRLAGSLNNLGLLASEQGDYASARSLYEEALRINREIGNRNWEAINLANLGLVAYDQGDYASARPYLEEGLTIHRELGNKQGIASALYSLGLLAKQQGDTASARSYVEESLEISRELVDRQGIAYCLEAFASIANVVAIKESAQRAARLWGAADRLRQEIGSSLTPKEREEQEREVAAVRNAWGEDAFSTAWAEGNAMQLEQAVTFALEKPDA